jgi:hypothetical protein
MIHLHCHKHRSESIRPSTTFQVIQRPNYTTYGDLEFCTTLTAVQYLIRVATNASSGLWLCEEYGCPLTLCKRDQDALCLNRSNH